MPDSALDKLVSYWRTCPVESPPYIPVPDREYLPRIDQMTFGSANDYINSSSFGSNDETAFHYGLLPGPYAGHLSSAKVFILLLNPGLSHGDYHAEYEANGFREEHIRNLYQENGDSAFPFHFLNPKYAWHPGFGYWQSKLDDILQHIASYMGIDYRESLMFLSQQIACLELVGYHSRRYKRLPQGKLPLSTNLILNYVQEELIPRATSDHVSLIVTRGKADWGITVNEKDSSIIQYNGNEARAAYLSRSSRGGAEILRRIRKQL